MGGAVSVAQIPMHIDKDTFRQITGGTFNDPIFDDFSVDGVMTRDKLLELSHTTDCFLSFDRQQPDVHGRSNMERVRRVQSALLARGLVCWLLEEQVADASSDSVQAVFNANKNNIISICKGIDKTRSVLCFLTQNYINRVSQASNTTDQCQIEFNYALRQRFPSNMIGLICEQPLLTPSPAWAGPVAKYLLAGNGQQQQQHMTLCDANPNCVDVTQDEPALFEAQIEVLFRRVVEITRPKHVSEYFEVPEPEPVSQELARGQAIPVKGPQPLPQTQGLPPAATREDAQFFQWLARCCSDISHEKRTVYCAALWQRGVRTVQELAVAMKEYPNFLTLAGVSERDADDIALAVSDLGLGYVPVRDFSNSTTVESAVYAMRKSCEAAGDPELGANALACIARIARADANKPRELAQAGCLEPVVKILSRNLGHDGCVTQAYLALQGLAVDDDMCVRLGDNSACDVVPRALQSHADNQVVVEEGCKLIAMLSRLPENNIKLGTAGACDVVMKGLLKHVAHPGVAQYGCQAATVLAFGNFENVGKLGYHKACEALSHALSLHYQNGEVVEHALKAMNILAVEPENRARMGKLGACEGTVRAMDANITDPVIVEYGLRLVTTMIVGNANNRTLYGQVGATNSLTTILQMYATRCTPSTLIEDVPFTPAASNLLLGAYGNDPGASTKPKAPLVFEYPSIVQYACSATYCLSAGSPQNQAGLAPCRELLSRVAALAAEYSSVVAKSRNVRKNRSTGSMFATNGNSNARVLLPEEAEAASMQKIGSEAAEAVQRVSKV